MNRRFSTSAALAAFAALVPLAALAQHGAHDASTHGGAPHPPVADARIEVEFPPALRAHTLANMREHLRALMEIQAHLAKREYDQAAQVAEKRLGMSSLEAHGAHDVAKFMPPGMREAGTAMHRSASRFAVVLQRTAVDGDPSEALGALAEVTRACVACHAGYRLK